jgi:hypothetical protein
MPEHGRNVYIVQQNAFESSALLFVCVYVCEILEFELEPLHQPFLVVGFFEIGSHELFAQAGLEPQSS